MKTYPLFKAHIQIPEAIIGITKVLMSGFINEGEQVTELTEALKVKLAAQNLVLVNSCTSALTLALHLAGVGPGHEVITTPMTCVATNTPIINAGARIVWSDVHADDGMIHSWDVEEKVTDHTRAVIAVAWAGAPPNLSDLRRLCDDIGVPLILDAAHAFGATYALRPIHEWADYACYSFQAIKHFTTGDGGAIVCRSDADHTRAKALKWFGLDRDAAKDAQGNWKGQQWDADISEAGYKFNMNNVSAAIGLSQLDHIDRILETHRRNAALYDAIFDANRDAGIWYPSRPVSSKSSAWVYTLLVNDKVSKLSRDQLLVALNAEGIAAGLVHVPNDTYTAFASSKVDLPGVREFSSTQLSLPCGWWLDDDDIRHIAARVLELCRG